MPADASSLQSAVLLVISESEETAKRIESHLRNAGHPVRAAWVTDLEDAEDVIRRSPPDLVMCQEGLPDAAPQDVIALCSRIAPDLPVVLMGLRATPQDSINAMAAGAKDLVSYADLKHLHHLELVTVRELLHHQQMRELRSTRVRLADFEARHRSLVDQSTDAVIHITEGILTHVNAAFAAMLGYDSPELLEGSPLMDLVPSANQSDAKLLLKNVLLGKLKGDSPVELHLQRQDNSTVPVKARLTVGKLNEDRFIEVLIRADAQPQPPAAAAPEAPAADAKAASPAAEPAAAEPVGNVPGLMPGRLAMFESLRALNPAKMVGAHGLLLVSVDSWETVENRLGFRDSEQVVILLSELLKQRLMPKDQVFRFSTSEIALKVMRAKPQDMEVLAETLRKDVAAQVFQTSSHEAHLSISVVAYPLSGKDVVKTVVSDVVHEGRKLTTQGGNKISILGPTAAAAVTEREELNWIHRIQKALQENRLKLAYQSIASLEGDSRQHFDVLVRMLDETGKEIQAKDFIPVAEKHGLIKAVDRWVVARALKVLAKREGARDVSSLFVRLSEATLQDADPFLAWLKELFKQRPLKKEEMVFQVQEVIFQNHISKAKLLAQGLKQLGAEVAVDHWGIGNNSIQLLDHIPASFVRFHHSFTSSFNDPKQQKRMTDLMDVAKQKSIKTIVSHVEDANVMARLWQMGVNYIQGHHIQEPEVVLLATGVQR